MKYKRLDRLMPLLLLLGWIFQNNISRPHAELHLGYPVSWNIQVMLQREILFSKKWNVVWLIAFTLLGCRKRNQGKCWAWFEWGWCVTVFICAHAGWMWNTWVKTKMKEIIRIKITIPSKLNSHINGVHCTMSFKALKLAEKN